MRGGHTERLARRKYIFIQVQPRHDINCSIMGRLAHHMIQQLTVLRTTGTFIGLHYTF